MLRTLSIVILTSILLSCEKEPTFNGEALRWKVGDNQDAFSYTISNPEFDELKLKVTPNSLCTVAYGVRVKISQGGKDIFSELITADMSKLITVTPSKKLIITSQHEMLPTNPGECVFLGVADAEISF